jgi:hypothetical protein
MPYADESRSRLEQEDDRSFVLPLLKAFQGNQKAGALEKHINNILNYTSILYTPQTCDVSTEEGSTGTSSFYAHKSRTSLSLAPILLSRRRGSGKYIPRRKYESNHGKMQRR